MDGSQTHIIGDRNISVLIENLTDIITILDDQGVIQYISPACKEILGYQPEEMSGHSFMEYVPESELLAAQNDLGRSLQNPQKTIISILHFRAKDGSIHILQSRAKYNPHKDPQHLSGIFVTSRDITREREHAEAFQTAQKLLMENLQQTIAVVAATAGARDTYTAGHQERVADLSVKIAKTMGITGDQLQGLKLAATIHDVGKVQIPSELLTKPMRLSELEYALVKTHAEAGYQILKDTHLPWPIAEIVRQHHEQIDGSGYPRGLMDGDILIEAKIIAIADTMEAMTNDRPYRKSPGLDMALDEIKRKRGVSYDREAVDICLHLFEKEDYAFPAPSFQTTLNQ